MIVNDILTISSLASDVRIINAENVGKTNIEDIWNTWDFGGDVPFDLAVKPVVYMSTTNDNTIVIGI